jgi:hypothetical protein
MTDRVIKGSTKSALTLDYTGDADKMQSISYSTPFSKPQPAKSITKFESSSNTGAGVAISNTRHTMNLNTGGNLYSTEIQAFFQIKGVLATPSNVKYIGLDLAQTIELATTSNVIYTQHDVGLLADIQCLPTNESLAILKKARVLSTAVATYGQFVATPLVNTTYMTFIPLKLPYFTRQKNWLSLNDATPMHLNIRFNSVARMGLPSAVTDIHTALGPDGNFISGWAKTVQYSIEQEQILLNENFNKNSVTSMLMYDNETNSAICTSTDKNTLKITSSVPAVRTYAYMRRIANILAANGAQSRPVIPQKYDFKIDNVALMEGIPHQVLVGEAQMHGNGGLGFNVATNSVEADENSVLCIPWNTEFQNLYGFSGAMPFVGLNTPTITFYSDIATVPVASEFEMVYVNKFLVEVIQDGARGMIYQSTAS